MDSSGMNMDATIQRMGALRLQDPSSSCGGSGGRVGVNSLWHATSKQLSFGPEESSGALRTKSTQHDRNHPSNQTNDSFSHGVTCCSGCDDQVRQSQQQQQQQQQLLEAKTIENERLVQEMQQMASQMNHLEKQNGLLKQQLTAMQVLQKQSQDQEMVIDQLRQETSQLRMSNYRLQWMLQQFESARDAVSQAGNGGGAGGGSQNAGYRWPPYPPPDIY